MPHVPLSALRCGCLAVLMALPLLWGGARADPARLTVSGTGQISAVPDMATVTLGVSRAAPAAAEALEAMSADAEAVLARLAAAGIAPRDIQTTGLTVAPRWQPGSPGRPAQVDGYEASTRVTVQIRDLDALGQVLAAVAAAGANLFQGLDFGLADPAPARNEARRRAVADARARAALYAEALGLPLGPLLALDEGGGGSAPAPRAAYAMASDAVPVAAGEITLSATVTLVYALGP